MSGGSLVAVVASSRLEHLTGGRLALLGDVPILEVQLRRLAPLARLAEATLVLATSDAPIDDPSAALAEQLGWTVVRGTPDDHLGWLTIAHARTTADRIAIVRDDAPLIDPYLVLAALRANADRNADHASNLISRTHPRGLEVESVSARALRAMDLERSGPTERATPTALLVRHPERFRLANLDSGHDLQQEDWSLRSPTAASRAAEVLRQVRRPYEATWSELVSIAGRAHRRTPGDVVLRPEPSPEAGSDPWVRRWTASIDGTEVGRVSLTVTGGRSERRVQAPDEYLEAVREALYRVLLGDLQVAPAQPEGR